MMRVTAYYGPPGTGKTTRLIKEVVDSGAKGRVWFMSYTRAAATEAAIRLRAHGIIGIKATTIHAAAYEMLGISPNQVVDTDQLMDFSAATGVEFARRGEESKVGDEYMSLLSYTRNTEHPPMQRFNAIVRQGRPDGYLAFVQSYTNWKSTFGFVDFDDMLELALRHKGRRVVPQLVILDEAQDCSLLQWRAFEHMIAGAQQVIIAGDDDQAIYEWNGADPLGMPRFAEKYGAKSVVLNKSYRVPAPVHGIAHEKALSVLGKVRVPKVFEPADHQGSVTWWSDSWSVQFSREVPTLYMVRDRFKMRTAERDLMDDDIPFDVMNGHSVWTNNTARAIRAMHRFKEHGAQPSVADRMALTTSLPADMRGYAEDHDYARLANMNWREAIVSRVRWQLQDFYRHKFDPELPVLVTLSTIHGAKGKESHNVVLDLEWPSRVHAEFVCDPLPESRVLYVGLTRAKVELHLCGSNPLMGA